MKKILKITVAVTIILALAFAGVMVKIIIENGECMDKPFEYSAKRLNKSGGDYYCSCQSFDPELLDFSFNETGINIIKPYEYEEGMKLIELEGGNE